ncbi:MAG: hypothetical protein CEO22_369 [Candidatus Berkelbacteria bacterium Gr01-1014_85]|uniref:Uncharacterized protein n=1 Tax=Candidatus Berkelbacteria bacterium Gr01-1014_85 TaxID=2017150 RepID=A0A554JBP3_9BACT|nr:MAG: hypothetical protein CEO22_369 [Candidatus Berkelbacteria bacterium Gr01-1014_85]
MSRTGIFNLTQYAPTNEQLLAGVVEPSCELKVDILSLLTFETPETAMLINLRALELAEIAALSGYESAMIGGAPFLMGALERALRNCGITPLYSFTQRRSVGKTQIFVHVAWVEAPED